MDETKLLELRNSAVWLSHGLLDVCSVEYRLETGKRIAEAFAKLYDEKLINLPECI